MLDRDGRVRVQLDPEGKPVGVTLDGNAGAMAVADRVTGEVTARAEDVDIVVAPIDLRMRSAIALRSLSGNPIVLVDDLGRMAGLMRRRRDLSRAAPAAPRGGRSLAADPSASFARLCLWVIGAVGDNDCAAHLAKDAYFDLVANLRELSTRTTTSASDLPTLQP